MKILTLETTCDETAAAIINGDLQVLGSFVASQESLHEKYSGVVPEIAARAHMERILPVIRETLDRGQIELSELDAVAVANEPGLSGSLLVGLAAAKTLAFALNIPLIAVNHLHAHVFACQIAAQEPVYPCVGLIVSGGHTHLYHYADALSPRYLGGTIDDAAGEAFDKVASMLGLPYPGGPHVSRVAEQGDPKRYRFPRSFINEDRLDFSFSGLKTAVRYAITGPGNQPVHDVALTDSQIADLAASFEQAVVDCLVKKSIQACQQQNTLKLCIGGGVAANRLFRQQLETTAANAGIQVHFAPVELCTDNAVMGAIAIEKLKAGEVADLTLDINPGLVRSAKSPRNS